MKPSNSLRAFVNALGVTLTHMERIINQKKDRNKVRSFYVYVSLA